MNFDKIIDSILAVEKGYVDHPNDRGGPTNFGITLAVARANGYQGDMRSMPESLARSIYAQRYIVEPKFDQVAALDLPVGHELIDTGVNMGPGVAATFLQRWLNGFNTDNRMGGDLFADGRIGPQSLAMLTAFLKWRGPLGAQTLLKALNCVQGARYLEIAENNKSQRAFLFGWASGRI